MLKILIASGILGVVAATGAVAAPAVSAATPDHAPFNGPAADDAFAGDMAVVHEMLAAHDKIARTVTNLHNGIRTVTESDDPHVAKEIKDHVASMAGRLNDGRVFNVASRTLPTIFANNEKIRTRIEQTPKGVIVTQTSTDPATVAALQAHAAEVSDLARGGTVALMRQMTANGGPMANDGPGRQGRTGPGMMRGMMSHDGAAGPPMMAQMMQRMMQSGGPTGAMTDAPMMMRHQEMLQTGPRAQTKP